MVLFMIGLGLGDERDITLRGLEAIKGCSKVCTRKSQRPSSERLIEAHMAIELANNDDFDAP